MNREDAREFNELLSQIHDYYRQPLSQFVADVFWSGLAPFPLEVIRRAFTAHATSIPAGKFCPKVAEIRSLIEGSSEDAADAAWSSVLVAISLAGRYSSVLFEDPIVRPIILDMGGWSRICDADARYLQLRERDFKRRYQALLLRARMGEPIPPPEPILGLHEGDPIFIPSSFIARKSLPTSSGITKIPITHNKRG